MKKFLAILLVAMMAIGLVACGGNGGNGEDPEDQGGEKKGLVYFCLNLGDLSFNDSGWEGSQKAAEKYGYEAKVIELGKDTSTYESAFLDACDSGLYSVVVTQSNYGLADLCMQYGPDYPDIKFIAFDMSASAEITTDNMFGIAFKQNEGSFLVGALSAAMSQSGKVGVFVFNDVPVGNDFLTGYIEGVRLVNPDAEISYAYGGGTADATKLQEVSSAMFDSGIDIIYGISGGANLGLFQEVIRRGGPEAGFYAIGVDTDQYLKYKNSENADLADAIVSSMLKNVGDSIVYAFDLWENGEIQWGTVSAFGIVEGGVGLADNDYYRQVVPEDVLAVIDDLTEKVVNGDVVVKSYFDFASYEEFAEWRDQ